MKIGYFLAKNDLPLSETWIRKEIEWWQKNGHEVVFDYFYDDGHYENLRDADFVLIHFAHVALKFTEIYPGVPFGFIGHAWDIWRDGGEVFRKVINTIGFRFVGVVSDFHKEKYLEWGCDEDSMVEWRNVVDTDFFDSGASPMPSEGVIAGGRHVHKKALHLVVEACPGATIFGEGKLTERLKEINREHNSLCKFVGWLNQDQLKTLMLGARALVSPSIVTQDGDTEGLSTLVMEGLSMGLQVLTTPVGGQKDIPGITYIEPTIEGIKKGLEDWDGHRNDVGRSWVIENHSIPVVMNNLLSRIKDECGMAS